nr:hypothetical protein [Actinomycetota bacterium]
MSRLWGQFDQENETDKVESEREALRRQRLEATAEIEDLKATLADRVAHVQERERELEQALARVDKREQALDSVAGRGARVEAMRTRLAEARAARAARSDDKERA